MLPFIEKAILRKHRWPGMPTANQGTTTLLLSSTTQGHCKSFHPSLWKTWNLSSVPPFPTVVETRIAGADLPCCRPMFNSSQPLYIFITFYGCGIETRCIARPTWAVAAKQMVYHLTTTCINDKVKTRGFPCECLVYVLLLFDWFHSNAVQVSSATSWPPSFWCNFMTTEFPMQLMTSKFPVQFTTSKFPVQLQNSKFPEQFPSSQFNFMTTEFPVQLHNCQLSSWTSWPPGFRCNFMTSLHLWC